MININNKSTSGSVLILVLWVIIFLLFMVISSSQFTRDAMKVSEKIEARKKLYDIAYSGILVSIETLKNLDKKDKDRGVDSLNDYWANDPGVFKDMRIGNGYFDIIYNYPDNKGGLSEIKYGLLDEDRKINVNFGNFDTLKNIFINVAGLNEDKSKLIAGAIIDWRDGDNIFYSEEEGTMSESAYYSNHGYDYMPANSDFKMLEELLLIKDIDLKTYLKIRDYLTVYSNGQININTASNKVLASLGVQEDLVEKIIVFRAGPDAVEGTSDDNLFTVTDQIVSKLALHTGLTNEEIERTLERKQ